MTASPAPRHLTRKDTPAFLALWAEFLKDYPPEALDHTKALLDYLLEAPEMGVALLEGDYAGLLWVQGTQNSWEHTKVAAGWGTYVRPTHQRQGVARRLWETAVLALKSRGFQSVILAPLIGDTHVHRALQAAGFTPERLVLKKEL